jgi:ParB-like chromosome segregation protein Spo0J
VLSRKGEGFARRGNAGEAPKKKGSVETDNANLASPKTERQAYRAIADIRIGKRHRKDFGDMEGLAASMALLGLLQPIVVTPDGLLLCGERRLRAAKSLGWKEIPVTIRSKP